MIIPSVSTQRELIKSLDMPGTYRLDVCAGGVEIYRISDDKPLPKWAEYWVIGFLVLAVVAVSPVLLPPIVVGWVTDKLSKWWDKD